MADQETGDELDTAKAPIPGVEYGVECGATWQQHSLNGVAVNHADALAEYHLLRYEFRPRSVDTFAAATLELKGAAATVTAPTSSLDAEQGASSEPRDISFKGKYTRGRPEECLLLFDADSGSFVLERLHGVVQGLKHVRAQQMGASKAKSSVQAAAAVAAAVAAKAKQKAQRKPPVASAASLKKSRQSSSSASVCSVCGVTTEGMELDCLPCDSCGELFHKDCVNLTSMPPGDWECSRCDGGHGGQESKGGKSMTGSGKQQNNSGEDTTEDGIDAAAAAAAADDDDDDDGDDRDEDEREEESDVEAGGNDDDSSYKHTTSKTRDRHKAQGKEAAKKRKKESPTAPIAKAELKRAKKRPMTLFGNHPAPISDTSDDEET